MRLLYPVGAGLLAGWTSMLAQMVSALVQTGLSSGANQFLPPALDGTDGWSSWYFVAAGAGAMPLQAHLLTRGLWFFDAQLVFPVFLVALLATSLGGGGLFFGATRCLSWQLGPFFAGLALAILSAIALVFVRPAPHKPSVVPALESDPDCDEEEGEETPRDQLSALRPPAAAPAAASPAAEAGALAKHMIDNGVTVAAASACPPAKRKLAMKTPRPKAARGRSRASIEEGGEEGEEAEPRAKRSRGKRAQRPDGLALLRAATMRSQQQGAPCGLPSPIPMAGGRGPVIARAAVAAGSPLDSLVACSSAASDGSTSPRTLAAAMTLGSVPLMPGGGVGTASRAKSPLRPAAAMSPLMLGQGLRPQAGCASPRTMEAAMALGAGFFDLCA